VRAIDWTKRGVLVAAAGVVVTIAIAIWPKGPSSPYDHIAECRSDHHAPVQPNGTAFNVGLWGDCTWPPASGAASDGFGEVRLQRMDNGVKHDAGYLGADLFTTKCKTLKLQYRLDQQGTDAVTGVFTESTEQVLALHWLDVNHPSLEPAQLPGFVQPKVNPGVTGRLVVIVPISVSVGQVACA
jgi:hypothetical protein